jgi:hypothetical protein
MWKKIEDIDYSINEYGVVRNNKTGHLSNGSNVKGYKALRLTGRPVNYIHRLVAKAFIPNPDNKPEVNHKNGIKTDNRANNLEWATRKENMVHANFVMRIIDRNPNRYSAEEENCILKMHYVYGIGYKYLGQIYNRSWSSIRSVIRRHKQGNIITTFSL